MLILNPGIIFVFASVKMDIPPKKWVKIVALNENTSMTVTDIASVVGVGKSSGSRSLCAYKDSESLSPNRKMRMTFSKQENAEKKRKTTPRTDQLLLRNSRLHPTMTSRDLQRDLMTPGIDIDALIVRRRLLEVGRMARKPMKCNC
jgi:hypothetical protein